MFVIIDELAIKLAQEERDWDREMEFMNLRTNGHYDVREIQTATKPVFELV